MSTAAAIDIQSDQYENRERAGLSLLVAATDEQLEADSVDATQGLQLGSRAYDDATQGRQLGSLRHDDATRSR